MKIEGTQELACPNCGNRYLHHGKISVYSRGEDQPATLTVIEPVTGESEITEASQGANPSMRRDGLVIDFECECCTALPQLCIAQHKGATLVTWRNTEFR